MFTAATFFRHASQSSLIPVSLGPLRTQRIEHSAACCKYAICESVLCSARNDQKVKAEFTSVFNLVTLAWFTDSAITCRSPGQSPTGRLMTSQALLGVCWFLLLVMLDCSAQCTRSDTALEFSGMHERWLAAARADRAGRYASNLRPPTSAAQSQTSTGTASNSDRTKNVKASDSR